MSATNTGWRLILLAATSPSLTVESNPITLELVSPGPQGPSGSAAAVTSVNGETGAVVLDAADVGAAASVHGHAIADVTGLQTALDGKAATSHTHAASQISDSSVVGRSVLTAADAAAARSALSAAASLHGHAIADVTGLQTALDGKAATSHTHGVGDVTGLGTAATRNAPAAGNAASSEVVLGNDSRLSDARTPTGAAGGGLTGNYPNPSLVAPGANGRVFWHSNGGFGNSAFFVWNNATSTLTLSNALSESVSFSPSGITANGPFTISDTGGGNSTAFTIDDAAETATFANFLAVDMTGATLTVDAIVLANGEFLSNAANGTLKLGVNGTNALEYSMLVDGTSWGYGVKLSTSQNSNPSNISAGFWFLSPLQISTGVPLSFDAAQTSVVQHVGAFTGTRLATHLSVSLGTLVQYGQDSSGAICIVDHAALGAANRRPSVTHTDPTLYVYARGSADATDFARMSHDTTDALLESGSGKLRLKGASVVRIEGSGGGFDIDPTPNSNGSVMTLNNGVVSFQTPTGGGGGVSEEDALALAVAL